MKSLLALLALCGPASAGTLTIQWITDIWTLDRSSCFDCYGYPETDPNPFFNPIAFSFELSEKPEIFTYTGRIEGGTGNAYDVAVYNPYNAKMLARPESDEIFDHGEFTVTVGESASVLGELEVYADDFLTFEPGKLTWSENLRLFEYESFGEWVASYEEVVPAPLPLPGFLLLGALGLLSYPRWSSGWRGTPV